MSRLSQLAGTAVLLALTQLLAGCSSGPGGDTTCSAYAKLSRGDQESAAKAVLREKKLDGLQWDPAEGLIQAYCRISEGTAEAHQSDPISSTLDIHG